MHTTETIYSEDGEYRVRLVRDAYADEPYNDGGSPILRFEVARAWPWCRAEQVTEITSHVVDDQIIEALTRWWDRCDNFERYMRIFHGTTGIEWYAPSRSGAEYVSFDTSAWRAEVGAEAGAVDMSEWKAYCDGDVYGYVVERRVPWTRDGEDPTEVVMVTWEEVDSLWGHYGIEYAEKSAREALDGISKTTPV